LPITRDFCVYIDDENDKLGDLKHTEVEHCRLKFRISACEETINDTAAHAPLPLTSFRFTFNNIVRFNAQIVVKKYRHLILRLTEEGGTDRQS
jgi:hypothetical protein